MLTVECSAQLRQRVGHLPRPFLACQFLVKGLGTRLGFARLAIVMVGLEKAIDMCLISLNKLSSETYTYSYLKQLPIF